jgi:recombination protein RecT
MTQKSVATPAPAQQIQPPSPRAQKLQRFNEFLEERRTPLATMLAGTGVDVDFFKQVAITAVRETPGLLDCDANSIWSSIGKAARDGLLPDGKDGKIIVRKIYDRKLKASVPVAGWQDMIGGLKKKIRRSKEVLSFKAEVVHLEDDFEYSKGDDEFIRHTPSLVKNRGPIIAAYSIAKLANGEMLREVMSVHECYEIRDKFSDGWKAFKKGDIKDTPWASSEGEMCKKTVARRLAKWLPMDTDIRLSIEHDDDDVLPGETQSSAGHAVAAQRRPQLSDFTDESHAVSEDGDGYDEGTENGGPVIEATANAQPAEEKAKTEEQAKPTTEQTAAAAQSGETPHHLTVMNIKARLGKSPRDVQNEIFDTEIHAQKGKFSDEEIAEFEKLLKD